MVRGILLRTHHMEAMLVALENDAATSFVTQFAKHFPQDICHRGIVNHIAFHVDAVES